MYSGKIACTVWGRVWNKKCPNDCPDFYGSKKA